MPERVAHDGDPLSALNVCVGADVGHPLTKLLAQRKEGEVQPLARPLSGRSGGTTAVSNAGTGWARTSGQSCGSRGVCRERTGLRLGAFASRAVNGAPSDQRSRKV